MVDNYISNSNLFLSVSNSGAPPKSRTLATQLAAVGNGQRLNQAAQQQYATNVVTTQSRKGPHDRFVDGGKQPGQREPTPVFPADGKKDARSSSKDSSYAMPKGGQMNGGSLSNQRQTLTTIYQQMKEQKDKEKKVTKSSFKDDTELLA